MTIDCARGCLLHGEHTPDCTCTHDCPEHDTHCNGCLPRPADTGHWCERCANHLRNTIRQLPALADQAAHMPDGRPAPRTRNDNSDTTRRPTKVDQHSPSPAYDLAEDAYRWLHSAALAVADERHERGPFTYNRAGLPIIDTPRAFARYLTERIDYLTSQPYADSLRQQAMQLHHQLTQSTGQDVADQRIPSPCPHCQRKTLVRPNGQDHVECRNRQCGYAWASENLGLLARETIAS